MGILAVYYDDAGSYQLSSKFAFQFHVCTLISFIWFNNAVILQTVVSERQTSWVQTTSKSKNVTASVEECMNLRNNSSWKMIKTYRHTHSILRGCAMVQMVIHWHLIMEVQVWLWVSPCGDLWCTKWHWDQFLLRALISLPCHFHSISGPSSLIICQQLKLILATSSTIEWHT